MRFISIIFVFLLFVGAAEGVLAPRIFLNIQDDTFDNQGQLLIIDWINAPAGASISVYADDVLLTSLSEIPPQGESSYEVDAECLVEYAVVLYDEFGNANRLSSSIQLYQGLGCENKIIEFSQYTYGCTDDIIINYNVDILSNITIYPSGGGASVWSNHTTNGSGSYTIDDTIFDDGTSYIIEAYRFKEPFGDYVLLGVDLMIVGTCGQGSIDDDGGIGEGVKTVSPTGGLILEDSELLPDGESPNNTNFHLAAIVFGTAIAFLMGGLTILEELKGTNTSSNMAAVAVFVLAVLCGLLGIIGWDSVFAMMLVTGINLMTWGD